MNDNTSLYSRSDKIKKALLWLSETQEKKPGAKRQKLLQEAEIRFDLSPADCTFLDKNFSSSESCDT
ncbi:hypothetical protein [Desulfogranum marinum]|jgi:hypothetical protein|uniref:hypothetical protein n=1 Tax=Desulfogranum marinum TaxID=453220 RepID=UPI00196348DE|nr:hypothetical protein [Desulfogranum marinum]MBM9511615.1 hypothetical protein [Desulfogranum marinum]